LEKKERREIIKEIGWYKEGVYLFLKLGFG
jgi:hypothetical protein